MFPRRWNLFLVPLFACVLVSSAANKKPNFVIIFTDDQGYGDLGCFGSKNIRTPNIDQMAKEGRRFTSFMVASPVCTPSRAALLTGCYPKRVGMHQHVLFPSSTKGLHPDEYTIADHLKGQGYATACYGKWHLGHHPETLPRAQGFDEYYGIPYSNDMNHPENKGKPRVKSDDLWRDQESAIKLWNTPLIENEKIVELPVDQRTVTRRYTDRAVNFIRKNKDQPFFIYLPHSMPHIPLYVPEDAYDPDPMNAYKCVIEHIDAEVGRIMKTIKELGLAEDTYVIYTSDNGPWLPFKNHGGTAGPLRDGKGSTFEGGQRVPCVMWGPGRIPAGTTCSELMGTIDMLPTIAALTNTKLPGDRKIDGMDASALLLNDKARSPRNEFVHYTSRGAIEGLRQGDWKLLIKQPVQRRNQNNNAKPREPQVLLFNLKEDLGEQKNLAEARPDMVAKLRERMLALDAEITKNARKTWTTDDRQASGKHFFILSGQSNMAGHRPEEAFTPAVEKALGKENVIVVQDAKGGQPIMQWFKEWKDPQGKKNPGSGKLYDQLMAKVKPAIKGQELQTVTFLWMQGENDARKQLGPVYEGSLMGLYNQLSKDLGRDDIRFVIGRLSDYDMANKKYPHWTMIRDIQVKVAESDPKFDWVNTDDLNEGKNRAGKPIKDDLHYSGEGYKTFGKRMAEKALELIGK